MKDQCNETSLWFFINSREIKNTLQNHVLLRYFRVIIALQDKSRKVWKRS